MQLITQQLTDYQNLLEFFIEEYGFQFNRLFIILQNAPSSHQQQPYPFTPAICTTYAKMLAFITKMRSQPTNPGIMIQMCLSYSNFYSAGLIRMVAEERLGQLDKTAQQIWLDRNCITGEQSAVRQLYFII